ncbi:MAG: Ig-like domain-containing protein [Bacteroidota bacterium]|nr:Ig-like domain-containing protein [Bacteroidota bacterium]
MKPNWPAVISLVVLGWMISFFSGGCANPIAPQGGPKDSLPPVLVAVSPKDSSEGFNARKITFTFNEFVVLDNPHDNLVFSPVPKMEPVTEARLRTVTVRIKDTLEANTTYFIDFGRALKDNNEGNVLRNFTYVFSTGPTIDSFTLGGKVLVAQTGTADSTLIVVLHRNGADSAVQKERPRFYAKLDSSGNFLFRHLPAGTFYLYAMKDASGQKRYLSRDLFAFADSPIVIGPNNAPQQLYAFIEKDTAKPKAPPKPLRVEKSKEKRLRYTNTLESNKLDIFGHLELSFAEPLRKFDTSLVKLTDTSFRPINGYKVSLDSSSRVVRIDNKWPLGALYTLILSKDFAEDTLGHQLTKADTIRFSTMGEADYGSLSIRFNNLDISRHPVVQLLQSGVVKDSIALSSNNLAIKLFRPAEYDLRILYDENGNRSWDPGVFFYGKHRQPERVQAIKKKITVKANWENDYAIDLLTDAAEKPKPTSRRR